MKIHDFNIRFSRVLIVVLIAVLISTTLVYALDSQPFTINSGIYPGAPSYTIWEQDGTYYAKNPFGVIVDSGLDASDLINTAVADGISIYITSGYYELTSPIEINAVSESDQSPAKRIYGDSLTGDAYFTKLQSDEPAGTVLASASGYTGSLISISPNNASSYGVKNLEIDHLTLSGLPLPDTSDSYADLDMANTEAGIAAANLINCQFHDLTIINCYRGIYLTTNGWTNDGIELNHIWFGYNYDALYVVGSTQVIGINEVYSYLNYHQFMYLGSNYAKIKNIFSNADDWELESAPSIVLMSTGYIDLNGFLIQNGKDGVKDGVDGIRLYIAVENATITVNNGVIQGVKTGNGIVIDDTDKAGFVNINNVFASPSETAYLGGEGGIDYAGIIEVQDDGTLISVTNSIFQNCEEYGMYGDFDYIANCYNGTDYIQVYP